LPYAETGKGLPYADTGKGLPYADNGKGLPYAFGPNAALLGASDSMLGFSANAELWNAGLAGPQAAALDDRRREALSCNGTPAVTDS